MFGQSPECLVVDSTTGNLVPGDHRDIIYNRYMYQMLAAIKLPAIKSELDRFPDPYQQVFLNIWNFNTNAQSY